jgi:hypothetical protein
MKDCSEIRLDGELIHFVNGNTFFFGKVFRQYQKKNKYTQLRGLTLSFSNDTYGRPVIKLSSGDKSVQPPILSKTKKSAHAFFKELNQKTKETEEASWQYRKRTSKYERQISRTLFFVTQFIASASMGEPSGLLGTVYKEMQSADYDWQD